MLLYQITNGINNKIYFSITSRRLSTAFSVLYSRAKMTERKHKLNPNYRKIKSPISKALVKHGRDNFIINIIKSNLTSKNAYDLKEKLIKEYNANNPEFGYNCTTGNKYYKINKEAKERMAVAQIDKKMPQSFIDLMKARVGELNPLFGFKHSKESRKNMSEAQKNSDYVQTEEVKKRKSETMKGHWKNPTEEMLKDAYNKKHQIGSRDRRGNKNPMYGKGMKGKDNPMYGMTGKLNPNYGKKLTDEQKKNLSDKAKIRQAKRKLKLIEKYKNMTEKKCNHCKEIKNLDMFYNASTNLSGKLGHCIPCDKIRKNNKIKEG